MPHLKETKNYLCLATGIMLAGGYADLVRGGTTLSAFLLAMGYCVCIPLAIWHGGAPATSDARAGRPGRPAGRAQRPPYGAAAIAALAVLAVYVLTMAPSTAMWDTSEYIAAAYSFGLPHPPGNPFFVIIGRVFSLLPIAPNVAARVNVLAALCSSVAAGVWFLITEHVLRAWLAERWQRLLGAAAAAVIGATAFTVWNQSVVNEKVYTVSLAGIALVSWLAVRWSERPGDESSDRLLVMIAYLCGLGYANHMAGMLPAPAVALAVIVRRPSTIFRGKLLAVCALVMFLGVTPFATQPIRAAYFPALNEGAPTACRDGLAFSCTFSEGTYRAFMYNFDRGQYGKPALSDRQASFGEQIGMWWLYFKWQWVRDPAGIHAFAQALFAAGFLVLGLTGGWVHYRRDRDSFWYFGALMFTTTLLLIFYLNFQLGASQDVGSPAPHEVRDRDYFYLWSFSAWSVWAALGLVYLWDALAALIPDIRRTANESAAVVRRRGWLLTSPLFALALVPLGANWNAASRAHHRATRDIAADLLNSVEPYGVLVTVGDNDTFPLWYAQEVEGIRRDVVIANTSLLNTDWYGRQLLRRPIYDYDEAKGPAIYRGKHWTKPTTPPLHMTMADVDAVPDYYPIAQPMQFATRDLRATIDPRNLEHGVLMRADALVLRMIQDSWPDRPFYFARSAPGYPTELGLGNYVLTQGLASKLFVPPVNGAVPKDTLYVQGDGWLDVARSKALWSDVFKGPGSVISEGQWVDRPSVSMPALYIFAGAELAEGLRITGRANAADSVLSTTKAVAHASQLDAIVQNLDERVHAATPGDSNGVTLHGITARQPSTPSTERYKRYKRYKRP